MITQIKFHCTSAESDH